MALENCRWIDHESSSSSSNIQYQQQQAGVEVGTAQQLMLASKAHLFG
jgi:hypothetical protein